MLLLLLTVCSCPPTDTTAGLPADAGPAATDAPPPEPPAEMTEADAPEPVRRALVIARAIQSAPDQVDSILAENGTTREQFESLMYEIAADPEMSRAFVTLREAR